MMSEKESMAIKKQKISKEKSLLIFYIDDLFLLLYGIIKSDFGSAFAIGRKLGFIIIYYAKSTSINHFIVAFYINRFAGTDYFFGIVGVLKTLQKIIFVAVAYIWIFSPYVYTLYVGIFVFNLCDNLKT